MADYSSKTSVRNLPALLQKVTVLVVDPDPPIANIIKHVLGNLGFGNIIIEHDSKAAMQIFAESTIDFIITDFDTDPPENGESFISFVRNSPESPNPYVPIILLTGHTERQDIEQARDQGVTEIAAKPFTAKTLADRVIRIIENPRSFIITKRYTGPDRRRKEEEPPAGQTRRKSDAADSVSAKSPTFFKRLLGKKS